jgi:hypothetical protein
MQSPDHKSSPSPMLEYHNPTPARRTFRLRFVRCLAALTAIAGIGINWWYLNLAASGSPGAFLNFLATLTLVSMIAMILRAGGLRPRILRRTGWIIAVAIFGLWTLILLSNQTHGMPPPSDRYVIAVGAVGIVLSALGLALDD